MQNTYSNVIFRILIITFILSIVKKSYIRINTFHSTSKCLFFKSPINCDPINDSTNQRYTAYYCNYSNPHVKSMFVFGFHNILIYVFINNFLC